MKLLLENWRGYLNEGESPTETCFITMISNRKSLINLVLTKHRIVQSGGGSNLAF